MTSEDKLRGEATRYHARLLSLRLVQNVCYTHLIKHLGSLHTTAEKCEIPGLAGLTVHTNPSRKRSSTGGI